MKKKIFCESFKGPTFLAQTLSVRETYVPLDKTELEFPLSGNV